MSDEPKMLLHRVIAPPDFKGDPPPDFVFWCPGCECGHGIWTTRKNRVGAIWTVSGPEDQPTVKPSIKGPTPKECHLTIQDGCIVFHGDSKHALAGKTVPMEPF